MDWFKGNITNFTCNEGNEIINSGKLDIIKNDSLRILISAWPAELDEAKDYSKVTKLNLRIIEEKHQAQRSHCLPL